MQLDRHEFAKMQRLKDKKIILFESSQHFKEKVSKEMLKSSSCFNLCFKF